MMTSSQFHFHRFVTRAFASGHGTHSHLAVLADDDDDDDDRAKRAEEGAHKHNNNSSSKDGAKDNNAASQMNMRGVFLHVLADALGSVVVIISAVIMWKTDWEYKIYVDPALSLVLVLLMMKVRALLFSVCQHQSHNRYLS